MMDKFTHMSLLLDIYGSLLSGKRKEVLTLTYNEDYSLTEIAELFGITRQGVRDFLVKGEKELMDYEEKLGILKEKFRQDEIIAALMEEKDPEALQEGLRQLIYYEKE